MHDGSWIRWFMVVFFAVFGSWLIAGRRFGTAGSLFCSLCSDEPMQARVLSAYHRRERSEALPQRWMTGWLAACSFGMAAVTALTHASVTLLYAALVAATAFVLTIAYLRLQHFTKRRFAALQVRNPNAIVPQYAWAIVATSALLPFLWLPSAGVVSALVAASGIVIVYLARRVALMPALLSGADVAAETYVDTRLRAARTTSLLATAAAPGFVFESFTGYTDSAVHAAAFACSLCALTFMLARQIRLVRCRPSHDEIATWFHAAP